jgi:hypothetical protein
MELRIPFPLFIKMPHALTCQVEENKGLVNKVTFYDVWHKQLICTYDCPTKEVVIHNLSEIDHTFLSGYVSSIK